MTIRPCSDFCREQGCEDPAACDDGFCDFCGAEDCDGTGYNCPDDRFTDYNLRGWPDTPRGAGGSLPRSTGPAGTSATLPSGEADG